MYLYESNRESRRAAGRDDEWGEGHRDVKGEISADVQSSTFDASVGDCGDVPKEKFSLNILMVSA